MVPTKRDKGIPIHPPHVGRDELDAAQREYERISIHPPRVGRDWYLYTGISPRFAFQSTLPVWGGTPECSMGLQA